MNQNRENEVLATPEGQKTTGKYGLLHTPPLDKRCFTYCGDERCNCGCNPKYHFWKLPLNPQKLEDSNVENVEDEK